jgi:hypothetical protein
LRAGEGLKAEIVVAVDEFIPQGKQSPPPYTGNGKRANP